MLKIHKPNKHKLLLIPITSILSIGVLLGLYGLTYTSELSHAETVVYPEPEIRTIANITYMQEITPTICSNTPEADDKGNNQYQLKDSRDQKTYWVAKLKDGNCWMTQNLDLDIPAEGLSAKDTDILEDWSSTTNPTYPPVATKSVLSGFSSTSTTTEGHNPIVSYDPGIKICELYQTACTTPATNEYDEHFLQGNFYSFNAALAGKGTTSFLEVNNSSICPKEWILPSRKLYNTLFLSYGDKNKLQYGEQDIRLSPLYFIYSGYVSGNKFNTYGYYWFASGNGTVNTARNLTLDASSVSIDGRNTRAYGLTIRCMTTGERTTENNVDITINPTISLDTVSEVTLEKTDVNPSTANLDVKVASNQNYSVNISSDKPALSSSTTSITIPSIASTLTSSTDAWGIKLSSDTNYNQITSTPTTFYTATGAEVKTIPFTIGISTSPDLPNGEYSTEITVTATQN